MLCNFYLITDYIIQQLLIIKRGIENADQI